MKKLLTLLTLLTLGLTLTPAKAALDTNNLPTTINISGWNFTGPAGDVSVDGTYTQS
jgi:hypothetical protein